MKKVLLGVLALAAAFAAAVVVLRRGRPSPAAPEGVVSERVLETMTRDELYELAKEYEIPGRSKMKKPDLLDAVSRAERSG